MTPGRTRRRAVAGLLALAVGLAACGDSTVTETNDGRISVSGTGRHRRVTIESGNGATVTYTGARVPPDFPTAVPRPTLRLTSAAVDRTAGGERFLLTYVVPAEGASASVLDAYRARLADAGLSAAPTGDTHLVASGGGWSVTADVMPRTNGTPGTLAVVVAHA